MAKTPAVGTPMDEVSSVDVSIPDEADVKKAIDNASAEVKIGIENTTTDMKKAVDSASTTTKSVVESATSAASKAVNVVSDEFEVASGELVNQMKSWVAEGNVRRLIVRTPDNKLVLEVPAVAGAVVGGLLILCAPLLALIGVIASMASRVKVEVVRVDTAGPKV